MNNLITKNLDTVTGTDILNLGSKPISEIRKLSNRISEEIDKHSNKSDMVEELNNILNDIDCEELTKIQPGNEDKNLFKKIISFGRDKADRIINKYKSITDNLNKMYREVESYSYELEKDNEVFREASKEITRVQGDLKQLIDSSKLLVEDSIEKIHNENNVLNKEKLSLLKQKTRDLKETLLTTHKMQEDIKSVLRRNYALYIRVNHLYSTTLPAVQHHINNFRIYQEHNNTNQLLKFMDEKKNDLMKLSTDKSIELERQLYEELNSRDVQNIEALKSSLEKMKQSNKELEKMQQEYIEGRIRADYNLIEGGDVR